jgi:hypothetical protein
MKDIRKSLAKNLEFARSNRDKLDPKSPLEATQWHRFDAVAAYINSLIDVVDNTIEIEDATNERVASGECAHDENGCHFDGYCKFRKAPDSKYGNGLPRCGLVKKNVI